MKPAMGKANGGERSEEGSFRPGGRDNRLKRLYSGKKMETKESQALFLEKFGRSLGRLGSIRKNLDCLGNPIIIHNDIE
jgi:hypothetical protein